MGSLTNKQIAACPMFLYTGKSEGRELVIPVQHVEAVFPGSRGIKDDSDLARRLKPSSDRLTRDRPVGPNAAQAACYVFYVNDLEG